MAHLRPRQRNRVADGIDALAAHDAHRALHAHVILFIRQPRARERTRPLKRWDEHQQIVFNFNRVGAAHNF